MPIPATPPVFDNDQGKPVAVPPKPMLWGHTYVSITGQNGEGEEIPLTGFSGREWPAVFMQPGAVGLDSPPFELHSDESPNLDGGNFRGARTASREIMIPVYLHAIDRRTLRDLKRKLIGSLNPRNGYCLLKMMEGDGQPRYLRVYYKGGMEGQETEDSAGFRWIKYGLQFTAFEPWFFGDRLPVAEWSFGGGTPFLPAAQAFVPLRINKGAVAGSSIPVVNPGDVEAWPVWEIHGPVRSFRLTGPDGKQVFAIPAPAGGADAVPADRTLTIDTRPGYKSLRDDLGANYWPKLAPSPALWSVPPGRSLVGVELVAGSGPATLKLTLNPRYGSY
ncbi:phage tail domain-containing protein [Streptomyces sp. NPDC056534]|uniref:phage tail domain-containing protein n=1 Tax=Streptomyces sp. NPDC056534 TaxID=3345857 RepID=UPI0036A7E8A1